MAEKPLRLLALALVFFVTSPLHGATLRVATFNVENYVDRATETRVVKSPESKERVRDSILAIKPDLIALQEMGSRSALQNLQSALKKSGLDLPYAELADGYDTNIHVAVLSRYPFRERRLHTNDSFLLNGRRFRVSRGFIEIDIEPQPGFRVTVLNAHLKSRRISTEADESELRLQEALLLRQKIEARLKKDPAARIIALGDFNDVKDSRSTRALLGRGALALIDVRPAERNGDTLPNPNPRFEPRNVTWTHYYGKEDTYSRVDYIFATRSLAKMLVRDETFVLALPNWGAASDHRPIAATFLLDGN